MPEYRFYCECGEKKRLTKPVSQCKYRPRCSECKRRMVRDYVEEHRTTTHIPGNWPLEDWALKVHTSQIPEARRLAAKAGVKIEFSKDGCPIYLSAAHRKEYAESRGAYDLDGGYADPQRGVYERKYRERVEGRG